MHHVPPQLSPEELTTLSDPEALLERARALEPAMRLNERAAALDRLATVLATEDVPAAPAGRDWRLEMLAERAIDATSHVRLDEADRLAREVLETADPTAEVPLVRALWARARVLAWTGTESASRRADAMFVEVAERLRALGRTEWLGFCLFWRANTIFFQNGELVRAVELMREALDVLSRDSPRRATILTFYADVLTALGEWEQATSALDQAQQAAEHDRDIKSYSYVSWSRAHISSARGDALATERHLRETEREADDWFAMDTGVTFLADAAEMLDRVGVTEAAQGYLARALARAPDDEFVLQAQATLLARSGDPWEGIEALQRLARGTWLEKRLLWRHSLLEAWAVFRAGREGSGALAARALEQAASSGGVRVAAAGEFELTSALAPLAERAGSQFARTHLLDGRSRIVRLFGTPAVLCDDGAAVPLPAGKPGELVRLLALHEHGLPVDVVLETFFPGVAPAAARHRLRQVLLRLRAADRDLLVREGDHLRLAPAWVDVRAFVTTSNRARSTRGARAVQLAYAALALHVGPLLPADPYAPWADSTREQVEYRYRQMLDLIVEDATSRSSHHEALTALEGPSHDSLSDAGIPPEARDHLRALGRHETADYLEGR